MHHSFVEALLRYLINENDLSKNPNWRRSAFNALFLAVLHHMCRLKNACAPPTSQSVVVPFSCQDFVCFFAMNSLTGDVVKMMGIPAKHL
jgi:hypothetical protein